MCSAVIYTLVVVGVVVDGASTSTSCLCVVGTALRRTELQTQDARVYENACT